jgi:hypothetical protein
VRFKNADPVWQVADKEHVATRPSDNFPTPSLYFYDAYFYKRINRGLKAKGHYRAENTNALDEVPNSTWFTNRIGRQTVTPQEAYDGPNLVGSPQEHKPWSILSAKVGGASIGFVAQDSRGVKFMLKFDLFKFPELETAADVITQRFLWAAGYNTPEDYILNFIETDLILGEKAYEKDTFGRKIPLTKERLSKQLGKVFKDKTGNFRGLASVFLKGELIGGHTPEGTRGGDPNDTIPHERRRELRGALPIFSWLDHVDVKDANAMDVYVDDPEDSAIKYVRHYWLDFGKSLGVHAQIKKRKHFGYEYSMDLEAATKSLLTLGLYSHPWADRATPTLRGVGLIGSKAYEPGGWTAFFPAYVPFLQADEADGFWGAKLLMKFTKEHIAAVVKAAQFTDPAAGEYLTTTLVARQRKTAAYWFARVTPLDRFTVKQGALCFSDLALEYQLTGSRNRVLDARAFDYEGRELDWTWRAASKNQEQCTSPIPIGDTKKGYIIVRLSLSTESETRPGVVVHIANNPDGNARPIGIWREIP